MVKIMCVVLLLIIMLFCLYRVVFKKSNSDISNVLSDTTMQEADIKAENLEDALYERVKNEILSWDEENIYAISFFIESNEAYKYNGFKNVSMWAISYNTEADCDGAGELDEERWNYAFWRQDETMIIDVDVPNKYTDSLFAWYAEHGITKIGEEKEDEIFDEDMNYTGKGPVGHYELLQLASGIAKRLQEEGVIIEHLGKDLPIIIHGLEYAWYDLEATEKANTNGQADIFFKAMKELRSC